MPRRSQRSTTLRKLKRTTPGGRRTIIYAEKRGGFPRCSSCGRPLPGTPAGPVSSRRNLSKTAKRPNRPYGGSLCSPCMRTHVKKVLGAFRE